MVQGYAEAKYDELHKAAPYHDGTFTKWGRERSKKTPYHYRDGVKIWVADTDLSPHDHFLGGAKDCIDCQPGDHEEVTSGDSS